MRKLTLIATLGIFGGLSACGDTVGEQALIGGAVGAGAAAVVGGNAVAGAAIGAGANAIYCNENPDKCE